MHKQKKKILSISLESKFESTESKFNKKKKKIISLVENKKNFREVIRRLSQFEKLLLK